MDLPRLSLVETLPTLNIWPAVVATLLGLCYRSWLHSSSLPPSIQWEGRRKEIFSGVRAFARGYTAGWESIIAGYRKFAKGGKPFIFPATAFEPEVMLPQEHVKWLINQPDSVLSARKVQTERLGFQYLHPAFDHTSELAIIEAMRVHLTRNLGKVQGALVDEMRRVTDATFGRDDQGWKEVNLFDAMHRIIFQSSGRILFGEALCHNETFLRHLERYSSCLGMGMIVVGQLVPWPLRPVVGPLLAIPTAYYRTVCANYLWPLFTERFRKMKRKRTDPSFAYTPPDDLITWMFRAAFDMKDKSIESPKPLASLFVLLVAGALSSSVVTATHTFLDLLGSDPQEAYYETLRKEAEAAFPTEKDWSQSLALLKLPRADSAIRETLRRNPVSLKGLPRKVVAKDGVTLPTGQHIPQGARIALPTPGIHYDERFYDQPDVYRPFRFVPPDADTADDEKQPLKNTKPAMIVTTSDTFLTFGHARGSCPGRWFASHLIKLLLAYVTIHYDIQPLKERPLNQVLGDHVIPPRQTTILVRRRK